MIEKNWSLLGIEKTTDKTLIRQAYRTQLPLYHPETDPDGFKALREAYEYALYYADSPESENVDNLNHVAKSIETTKSLSEEEQAVNQICQHYEALLKDPKHCYDINAWHQFVAQFYDYPMAVIDIVRWKLLDISYNTSHLSLSCVKVLADNLRWRQELMSLSAEQVESYDSFLTQVENGDSFDYSSLPTDNKAIQDATLEYIGMARWLFWERPIGELAYFLSLDTVIYLPDDIRFMTQFSNWCIVSNTACPAVLSYSLLQQDLAKDENERIKWKHIAARQYSLLDDKENALKYWLELYYAGHYQEKAMAWLIYWCSQHAPNYLPLLVYAVNQSDCTPTTSTENLFYAIPQLNPTTVARITKIKKEEYPSEIADFIQWGSSQNWGYRQILQLLLRDDGESRLYRLYRHAVMLRHGNKTLLQEILDDSSDDPFEHFILLNLQRQAKQNIAWLTHLPIVQEFKAWLYDDDPTALMPLKFELKPENNQFYYARMWLDRFRYLPEHVLIRLYNHFAYADMEMFDWIVFLYANGHCSFTAPPSTTIPTIEEEKQAYWQWYRYYIAAMALAINPVATAKNLKQDTALELLDNSPIASLVETIKSYDWQDEAELYKAINNDNSMVNCILSSFPDSIEYVLSNSDQLDLANIQQKVELMWQPKLANSNPVYLMLLQMILLHKPEQKAELSKVLTTIAGDSKDLKKVQKAFENGWSYPFSKNKDPYGFTPAAQKIQELTLRFVKSYGLCDDDEIASLVEFKNTNDNDLLLRLCIAMLLDWDEKNQKALVEQNLPVNKISQFWRWNGRTTVKGFLQQLLVSGIVALIIWICTKSGTREMGMVMGNIAILAGLNALFAFKRRLNDGYMGERFFFIIRILVMPLAMFPCWQKGLSRTNRYGPPVEK